MFDEIFTSRRLSLRDSVEPRASRPVFDRVLVAVFGAVVFVVCAAISRL